MRSREFRWLWTAFALSTAGTWLALDAFPLIAVLVLHSSTAQVSLLASAGLAVGALLAVPLGPWVEFRRKRPVMIAADGFRFVALMSVPAAYAVGCLRFAQLVVVAVLMAAADIGFRAASGACLKALVRPADLITANARFETTAWTATVLGPPLGGAAVGVLGPLTTVLLNAVSFLLSALGLRAMGRDEPPPPVRSRRTGPAEIAEGWRYLLHHPLLRPLFLNTTLVNGLILATAPILAVLLLRDLGFAPWQYGLAFGVPCLGGLLGSRLSTPLTLRYGQQRILTTVGTLRACWSVGLAFVHPGWTGLLLVIVVELGLITCMGVFNPVYATYRLQHTATDRVARTLAAWSITNGLTVAACTLLWGLLATLIGARTAIAVAGVLLLVTPALLPGPCRSVFNRCHASAAVPRDRVPPGRVEP